MRIGSKINARCNYGDVLAEFYFPSAAVAKQMRDAGQNGPLDECMTNCAGDGRSDGVWK